MTSTPHAPVYDPFDQEFLETPYPAYRWLRDNEPVHHNEEHGFWALSRFDDIWEAVREPELFSSASGLTFHPDEIGKLGLAPTIVMLDPPRHTQLRRLISSAFTPRRVNDLEADIRRFVRTKISHMREKAAGGTEVDLHRDFSSPLPTYVLASLLGVPESDRARFDPWVSALTTLQDNGFEVSSLSATDAVAEMFEYFSHVITRRRENPGDDLISALGHAEADGQKLSDWDILGFCFVLVAGGNDTTGNLISHGVALLDSAPGQRQLLIDSPELIAAAVPEFLRMEGSVQGLARTTTRTVRLHDVDIPAGEKVMMLYGSGNRDEREFGPDAHQLDVTRQIPRHLGFSNGPHFCIGSHLARMQARVAFEELLARQPHIGVDLARAERIRSAFTRGWVRLPATGIV